MALKQGVSASNTRSFVSLAAGLHLWLSVPPSSTQSQSRNASGSNATRYLLRSRRSNPRMSFRCSRTISALCSRTWSSWLSEIRSSTRFTPASICESNHNATALPRIGILPNYRLVLSQPTIKLERSLNVSAFRSNAASSHSRGRSPTNRLYRPTTAAPPGIFLRLEAVASQFRTAVIALSGWPPCARMS